jgi:hypothetical protein
MTEPAPRWVDIGGVVFDINQVPDKDEPAESHVRYTGESYTQDDGTEVHRARMHAGPAEGYPTEQS